MPESDPLRTYPETQQRNRKIDSITGARTAKAIGLTIPDLILAVADEVIGCPDVWLTGHAHQPRQSLAGITPSLSGVPGVTARPLRAVNM